MTPRKRWPPASPGVQTGEVIVGRTTGFTLAPGNPLRAASCLICARAAGPGPVSILSVFGFDRAAGPGGMFYAASWLVHETHPHLPDGHLAGLAFDRQSMSLEEQP